MRLYILVLLLLSGCSLKPRPEPKFRAGTRVRIMTSFYKGCVGHVVKCERDILFTNYQVDYISCSAADIVYDSAMINESDLLEVD